MGRLTVLALRGLIVLMFAGLLFVQVMIFPLLGIDIAEEAPDLVFLRWAVVVVGILGVLTVRGRARLHLATAHHGPAGHGLQPRGVPLRRRHHRLRGRGDAPGGRRCRSSSHPGRPSRRASSCSS